MKYEVKKHKREGGIILKIKLTDMTTMKIIIKKITSTLKSKTYKSIKQS